MYLEPDPLVFAYSLSVLSAWIFLYWRGKPTRDLLFWGAIAVALPIIGPMAMTLYFVLRRKGKR